MAGSGMLVVSSRIGEMSVDMVNKQEAIDDSSKKLQAEIPKLTSIFRACHAWLEGSIPMFPFSAMLKHHLLVATFI